jgi:uncharacterized iron-regulated membrane protein
VHIWTGVLVGLYMAAMSLSGGVLVFYPQVHAFLLPHPKSLTPRKTTLSSEELRSAIEQNLPGARINWIWARESPPGVAEVWLEYGGVERRIFVDASTGANLGPVDSAGDSFLNEIKEFHRTLLLRNAGRVLNGVGAFFLVLSSCTGAVIWWPGNSRWRRHLFVRWGTRLRRFNWELHSAVGVWAFPFMWMWGVTGIAITLDVDRGNQVTASAFGNQMERWIYAVHFGSFGGTVVRMIWAIVALAPPLLFVTGLIMWRNRIGARSRRLRSASRLQSI